MNVTQVTTMMEIHYKNKLVHVVLTRLQEARHMYNDRSLLGRTTDATIHPAKS